MLLPATPASIEANSITIESTTVASTIHAPLVLTPQDILLFPAGTTGYGYTVGGPSATLTPLCIR